MDDLTPEQRKKNMRAIRSKDTTIELALRKALWKQGIHYRKNYKGLIGKPDIVITKYRIAVFCDSDLDMTGKIENPESNPIRSIGYPKLNAI